MADSILSSVADQIIGWLGSQAAQEIGSLFGVTKDLEDLKETLSMVKAVLGDAERKKIGSERVSLWLGRLEDVIDEADDLMDELSTEDLRRQVMFGDNSNKMIKKVRTFFSSSNQVAFRWKIAHKIKDLKEKLEKIENDAKVFHFDALPQENYTPNIERETHSFVAEEDVTGREEEKMAVIKMLMDNQHGIKSKVPVIPIVGAGGVEKTTLVQLVFNDNKVQEYFDTRMWVCVSDDFDVKLLVGKIIKSVTNDFKSLENVEMEILRKDLQQKLFGKRYLLVLDDVWNEDNEKWRRLIDILAIGGDGSRLILTTRSEVVANITGTIGPYHLRNLDDDKSWSLFKKMAFGRGEDPKDCSLVENGKKIVEKCGGVPLAIKTIGRMLHSKNPETEWLSLVEKQLGEIYQKYEGKDIVYRTLELSYDHLPSYLKQCFCYCSLFPKDYKINVKELVKLWMAQGFINSTSQDKCLEEEGNEYFMKLLWRSFFQEVEKDEYGDIVSCKMHDLKHDLAMSLAGKKCKMLDLNKGSITIGKEVRHLALNYSGSYFNPFRIPNSMFERKIRIRSILSHSGQIYYDKKTVDVVVSGCKYSRLLDLHGIADTGVPNSIGNSIGILKCLRYLDLSYNYSIRTLPNSISQLINLQTLKLNECLYLVELPKGIKKLVNLRHLEIDGCDFLTHMPSGLGQLTNLQTLSQFVLKSSISFGLQPSAELNELAALNLGGGLTIRNLRHGMDSKVANFENKTHIRCLKLVWDHTQVGDDGSKAVDHEITLEGFRPLRNLKNLSLHHYRGVHLPNWFLSTFSNLVKFELRHCIKCQYLPRLNQLCSLKELILEDVPALEYVSENGDSFATTFPCLLELQIIDCPKLNHMPLYPYLETLWLENASVKPLVETMMRSPAASALTSSTVIPFSNLTYMSLNNMKNLQSLPESRLTSLKMLAIERCHELKCLSPLSPQNLSSLEVLTIYDCEELDISSIDDIAAWQCLRSLLELLLIRVPKLMALLKGLQHVTALRYLWLNGCENLRAVPEWIGNFTSLQRLRIEYCPKLTSLPEAIRTMTSLKTLEIEDCTELDKRCQRETGEDWPKIAHIPDLYLTAGAVKPVLNKFKLRVPQLCFKSSS